MRKEQVSNTICTIEHLKNHQRTKTVQKLFTEVEENILILSCIYWFIVQKTYKEIF